MFKFLKKIEKKIYSPVNGVCINLSEVSDEVFASRMMGEGVAFHLNDGTICSPVNGVVTVVAETKHAIGFTADNGTEILLHIGLNTVELEGKGFEVLVTKNDKVKKGQIICQISQTLLNNSNVDLTTPMVVTNSTSYKLKFPSIGENVFAGNTEIILIE